ncbi:MAG: SPFH domain-containing protein, partial [Fibrobacterota bacterium]
MGLFNKNRTDGQTSDGTGEERKGFIDRIKYDGLEGDLIWKFPYDNISTGAQLIVNESQEALFFKGGQALDLFGPGTHTLDSSNIPLLQKVINIPFGSRTPFSAEVWYINKTVDRALKWGTRDPMDLEDPLYGYVIPVRAFGKFGIQISDSRKFITQLVGTQHLTVTDKIVEQFISMIINKTKATIAKYIDRNEISILKIQSYIEDVGADIQDRIKDEFDKYGILLTNFDLESINVPQDDESVMKMKEDIAERQRKKLEGQGNRAQIEAEGPYYGQRRSFDVMETAAGNEGGAGTAMGAGMGMGMGFGVGGAMGNQMQNMGSHMNTGANGPQQGPPPPPQSSFYVLINGAQKGPFNMDQLTGMRQRGELQPETMVWSQGMPQWGKAGEQP